MNLKSLAIRFLNFINVFKHIKKLYLKVKIKQHKKDKKLNLFKKIRDLLTGLIILLLFAGIIYFNYLYQDIYLLLLSCLLFSSLLYISGKKIKSKISSQSKEINKLILTDQNDKKITEWEVKEATSLIFGKQSKDNDVDIDLSNAVYSSLISRQHAVMNNTGDKWYFEDIGSQNGSGIKKRNSKDKFKVKQGYPYQINSGDVIYIANTKLLIK